MNDMKTNTSSNVLGMVYSALFAALMAVCSWISIPMTIPITLQTFGVCVATAMLGTKFGFLSVLVFILLGAIGIPVFQGFSGGIGVLLGTTGGYIIGFLFTALIVGIITDKFGKSVHVMAIAMALGILVCYAFGTAWFMVVYTKNSGAIGLGTALGWCVIPYLIPDAIKIMVAIIVVKRLGKYVRIQGN